MPHAHLGRAVEEFVYSESNRERTQLVPSPKHGVDFVNEDDARGNLVGKAEERTDVLFTFAKPLGRQGRHGNIDEIGTALRGDCLRQHRLSRAGWAKEQHALGRLGQVTLGEQLGSLQWKHDNL